MCIVPCDASTITVTPSVPDAKATVTVNDDKPGSPTPLNVGDTKVDVSVTSTDGSNTQVYTVFVTRKQLPRYVKLLDPATAMQYECPVSLAPLYRPISIRLSEPKHTYSAPIIDELTRTCKVNPLNDTPLEQDWRIQDFEMDQKMSQTTAEIPLIDGTSSESGKLFEIGAKISKCSAKPKITVSDVKYENVPLKHSVQVRGWEKRLQQVFDETNVTKLSNAGADFTKQYLAALPTTSPSAGRADEALELLQNAIHNYATAIKQKGTDPALHLKLAMLLEERYYAADLFGVKAQEDHSTGKAGTNTEAQESSKEEECAAICQLRGVSAGAPLSLQLQAIDQEYHHLVESGQSGKADHVQGLYQWKAKQATKEGAAAQRAADEESPLGQAYLKYLDALSLDETKAVYHLHVGRMLVTQGQYEEAVTRLGAALSWNPQHEMARFYLGLALSLQKAGPGTRSKEAVAYLLEGCEALLQKNSQHSLDPHPHGPAPSDLLAENLVRSSNVYMLRGIIQLGRLLQKSPDSKDAMSSQHVFHTAALIASQVLTSITRGDTYQLVEWMLLEAHSQLLDILLNTDKNNTELIAQRCERLMALIKRCTIPQGPELLSLQLKTCERLVTIQPCSSYALYLLGSTQLTQFDNNPEGAEAKQLLEEAKTSFRCSIALEGKPASGDPPQELTGQKWWQDKLKAEEEKKKAQEPKQATPAAAGAAKPAAGRGGPAARGAPARGAARGAATPRGGPARGAAATGRGGAARGGAATKATTPAKASPAIKRTPKAVEKPAATADSSPAPTVDGSSDEQKSKEGGKAASSSSKPAPLNRKTHHARLGLARALAKNTDNLTESKKYYDEVITMAPEIHDAYIEIAEMLTKSDPMGAVDIYSKFPVSEQPTFDDAYIFGEIVQLLMKAEQYDDPRLGPNMIALGRVMGLGSLEKYVDILDGKFKTKLLMSVYAGVNGKEVDDPDMQAFFKFKLWN